MKRFLSLFLLLALLTGCGAGKQSGLSAQSSQSSTLSSWGLTEDALPSVSPSVLPSAAADNDSSVESSSLEAPTPTPEPLPASLAELCPSGPSVLLDGAPIPSLRLQEVTLINAADLSAAMGWFQSQGGTESAAFTRKNGESFVVPCVTVNGQDQGIDRYTGEGGICFTGAQTEYWLPVRDLAQELDLPFLWDEEEDTVYVSTPVDRDAIPQGVEVPILMYHAVSDDMWGINSLFVSPEDLRAQLDYLTQNGYDPIFFSDLPHLSDYDKPILLTFDDGYDDNYTELYPILQEYGVKATVFVITGMLGDEHYLTEEQVQELSQSGLVDIQSHTVTHTELSLLSYDDQDDELAQSRLDLARITGKLPYALAYPSGERDDDTLALAPEYYSFGIDMNGGVWTIAGDYYRIDRIYISRFLTLDEFIEKIP